VLLAGELGDQNMPVDFADKDAHLKIDPVYVPDIAASVLGAAGADTRERRPSGRR
jgi:hypothetical protein